LKNVTFCDTSKTQSSTAEQISLGTLTVCTTDGQGGDKKDIKRS